MMAFCVAAAGARARKDTVSFFKYAMKAVAMEGCSEICLELGRFYYENRDLEEAAVWLYNAVYETQPLLSLETGGKLALELLVQCYKEAGNEEQAAIYEEQLKNPT